MLLRLLTLGALAIGASPAPSDGYRIEGVVVNGTQGDVPVDGAEVILRAGEDGALLPVAKTTTDRQGHFTFDQLPVQPGLVYRAGVNRQGIHYPGPRLVPAYGTERVRVTAYDTSATSPLVAELHELDIQVETGVMTVKETLVVSNPTRTTYVGEPASGGAPVTLSLHIPAGYERVTFADEFHGRNFNVLEGLVVTDIPWTPGKRELHYTYRLPVEESKRALERSLDLPASLVRVRVRGENSDKVTCNLPRAAGSEAGAVLFESAAGRLAAGHCVSIQFSQLTTPWIAYARWTAVGVLAVLILGTAIVLRSPLGTRLARRFASGL
jgi:hypothetical protein